MDDDDGGDEHAAPTADGEAEVPAGEVSGNDRANAERPKREDARVALQLTFIEIVLAGDVIRDPAFMFFLSHFRHPLFRTRFESKLCRRMARSSQAGLSGNQNLTETVCPLMLAAFVADLIVANLDHDRRQASWARVAFDRVIDLIGRSIRLVDADGQRRIGLQGANEISRPGGDPRRTRCRSAKGGSCRDRPA